jgi:hypothetical protein
MKGEETLEDQLVAITLRLNQISIILYNTVLDLVSRSDNWREAIAEMRGEICRTVAEIACDDLFAGDREVTHAQVHQQVQLLFDELQEVIDAWALRVMEPETTNSGRPIIH